MISPTVLVLALAAAREPQSQEEAVPPAPPPRSEQEDVGRAGGGAVPIDPLTGEGGGWEWDEALLDMQIDDAIAQAVVNNLQLRISENRSEVARFDALGSWGAFDWVFDASLRYQDTQFPQAFTQQASFDVNGDGVVDEQDVIEVQFTVEEESLDAAFDLTRPLTTGGRFMAHFDTSRLLDSNFRANTESRNVDALSLSYVQPLLRGAWSGFATSTQREAELAYARQLATSRAEAHDVLVAVELAYWELVSALEQFQVANSALELGRIQLDRTRRLLEVGHGTEVDVLQSETEVATREELLLQRRTEVLHAMDELRRLVFPGEDPESRARWQYQIRPTTEFRQSETIVVPAVEEALQIAQEKRPDLEELRIGVDLARLIHERSLSLRQPALDLSLTAGSANRNRSAQEAFEDTVSYEFPTYTLLLNYSMALENRTASFAERAARVQLINAQLALESLRTEVLADVRRAVRDVQYRFLAVEAAEKRLSLAMRQFRAEEARFRAGESTTFQVLEFQQSLIEARVNERQARVALELALVALRDAQGIISD